MSLQNIKRELKAGARPNKYRIKLNHLGGGPSDDQMDILCKASSIPEATIGVIDVYNQGRKLPIAGDKSYGSTWDVTFYNTQALDIRNAFENWMRNIDDVESHYRNWQYNGEYMVDMQVEQLDGQNNTTSAYKLYNCWPSNITSVDLADDSNDTVSEFTVTITFSHWEKVA
jgi:hypothetical protein